MWVIGLDWVGGWVGGVCDARVQQLGHETSPQRVEGVGAGRVGVAQGKGHSSTWISRLDSAWCLACPPMQVYARVNPEQKEVKMLRSPSPINYSGSHSLNIAGLCTRQPNTTGGGGEDPGLQPHP